MYSNLKAAGDIQLSSLVHVTYEMEHRYVSSILDMFTIKLHLHHSNEKFQKKSLHWRH